jgi:hypothetical protein
MRSINKAFNRPGWWKLRPLKTIGDYIRFYLPRTHQAARQRRKSMPNLAKRAWLRGRPRRYVDLIRFKEKMGLL